MNDFLFAYLDAIDESLLDHLDDDQEVSLDTVRRLKCHTSDLLMGTIAPRTSQRGLV